MTATEFERLPDDDNQHELDEGELILMPPTMLRHGRIQALLARVLDSFARDHKIRLAATVSGTRLSDDTIRWRLCMLWLRFFPRTSMHAS